MLRCQPPCRGGHDRTDGDAGRRQKQIVCGDAWCRIKCDGTGLPATDGVPEPVVAEIAQHLPNQRIDYTGGSKIRSPYVLIFTSGAG